MSYSEKQNKDGKKSADDVLNEIGDVLTGRSPKKLTVRQCVVIIFTTLVAAFAGILIASYFLSPREKDLAEDEYIFEYGEDALAGLKGQINADEIDITFQAENNLGYPKTGRYTGKAISGNHEETFTVLIQDTTPPEFTSSVENLSHTIGEGSDDAVLSNFVATDLSGAVEMNIQGDVDYKSAGSYSITVSATDLSRNTSTVNCVVEITNPVREEPQSSYESYVQGQEDAYDMIQNNADRLSGDYREYTDEEPIDKNNHIEISTVGIDLDVEERDDSTSYFEKDFTDEEVCLFTAGGLSYPGGRGSSLIGGSSIESLTGLPSVAVGDIIDVYWDGVGYKYQVTFTGECSVSGNRLINPETGLNEFEVDKLGVLQLYTNYVQSLKEGVWFVKAELAE